MTAVLGDTYEATANELSRRIEALFPAHPELLKLTDPWALFKIPGFKCDDLQPSLWQAAAALACAQDRIRNGVKL